MLLGSYFGRISHKRRIAVPQKLRASLGESFILAKWYEGCLILVSETGWEALLKRLTGTTELVTKTVRDTDRFILGTAYEMVPDDQGRIVIPGSLAEHAGLTGNVRFVGLMDRVEIWDEIKWLEKEKEVAKNASEIFEKMAKNKNDK